MKGYIEKARRAVAGTTAALLSAVFVVVMAPTGAAAGYADCFTASGNLNYDGSAYSIDIRGTCGPVGTSDDAFGQRVLYQVSGAGFCGSKSGTLFVGSFGESLRISTSCLDPGTYRPEIKFSSFADSSYNFVYLSSFTIREPEPSPTYVRPSPTPRPTPTPTFLTPTNPTRPSSNATSANPGTTVEAPLQLEVRKTKRGAKVLQSTITPWGAMSAVVSTRLDKGDRAQVETSSKDPVTGRWVRNKRDVKVRKSGRVRVTEDVERYSYVWLRDPKGRLLVRWTTK